MDAPLTPRLIHAVPPQLGTYLRPNQVDHKALLAFLAGGTPAGLDGIVFDPTLDSIQSELRDEVRERGMEAVLDPRAQASSLPRISLPKDSRTRGSASTAIWRSRFVKHSMKRA